MASNITAQNAIQAPTMQQTVAQTPMVKQQPVQTSAQPTQIMQIPATPGPSVSQNVQAPQGNVKYIKLPTGVTKGTYNLRSTSLNAKTPTTNTAIPVSVARGKTNPQNVQVKQKPTTPGMPSTPKATTTTTMVRKERGRGKQASTISVLDTVQDGGEYSVEVEGEEFEDSDSDATELYEILANITEPEEETSLEMEPELDPPI